MDVISFEQILIEGSWFQNLNLNLALRKYCLRLIDSAIANMEMGSHIVFNLMKKNKALHILIFIFNEEVLIKLFDMENKRRWSSLYFFQSDD